MTDKVFDFIINSVRTEERRKLDEQFADKPKWPTNFWVEKKAGDLVVPCKKKAEHHRNRELYHTKKLEEAEKELREKGLSVEVFDPRTGTSYSQNSGSLSSGAISMGGTGTFTQSSMPKFQPRIDQNLLSAVERSKTKMLEHRNKAEEYEKKARAYALAPDFRLALTVEDVDYYGLECVA